MITIEFRAEPNLWVGQDMDGSRMEAPSGTWSAVAYVTDGDDVHVFEHEAELTEHEAEQFCESLSEAKETAISALCVGAWSSWRKIDVYPSWIDEMEAA